MPRGKPAGQPCVNLDPKSLKCVIWGSGIYPETCSRFKAEEEVCGTNRDQALQILTILESATQPSN